MRPALWRCEQGPRQTMNISACIDEILIRGLDDWIQAAEVASIAKSTGNARGHDQIRAVTLSVVGELLRRGLVQLGQVSPDGFSPFDLSEKDLMARVDAAWVERADGPELGDYFWLNLTDEGHKIANQVWTRMELGQPRHSP